MTMRCKYIINWVGIISVLTSVICSLIIENYYLFGVFFVFGVTVLIIGKCIVDETPKYRVFLPAVQLFAAFAAILYGSLEIINKSGLLYSVLLCLGGFSIIIGLKIPRIFIHRLIASPLAMILFFYSYMLAYRVNAISALVSASASVFVILFGIVFSDRNWYAHLMIKK